MLFGALFLEEGAILKHLFLYIFYFIGVYFIYNVSSRGTAG